MDGSTEISGTDVTSASAVVNVKEGNPELSGRSEDGRGTAVTDTIPGNMAMAVKEEDVTEDGLSLAMETGIGTGPVVSAENIGSGNTDSVVWLAVSVREVAVSVSIGPSVAVAVELTPSRMLVIISRPEVGSSKVVATPVEPGPVIPSRIEDGASVVVDSSSPVAVLITGSSSRMLVGTRVLAGSSSAVEVSTAVEVTPVPLPLPVIPDSDSALEVEVTALSLPEVEVGSSDEVRIPLGPKVISFSMLVSFSLVEDASEVLSEVDSADDSELVSTSEVGDVEVGRMIKSGSPRVVPTTSSPKVVENVDVG